MKRLVLCSLALVAAACGSNSKKTDNPRPAIVALPATIEAAVSSSYRTPKNLERDKYRHPSQTLDFFGLKEDMTVVEIWPSAGWYAEILAPYLVTHGHYVAAEPKSATGGAEGSIKKFDAWLSAHPEIASKITTTDFVPPSKMELGAPGSADMVLTFRNVHNWDDDKQAAFNAFFKVLKPGGVLGVVDHRAKDKGKLDPDSGYLKEKHVISLAEKAGFKLAAKSEINANPKDTKDYEKGVWALAPANRHDDKDNAKFAAIGESDRMTLKFIKPKK
jgi:predicted methyltransferase